MGPRRTHEALPFPGPVSRLGISAGMLSFMSVRGGDRQFFFVCSGALDEVVKAQKLSAAHEVVLSQTCWELCDQKRIRAKPLAGKGAVKVVGMRRLARREWKDAVVQLSSARGERHLKGTGEFLVL
eukprot:XP_025000909.1 adenylate cyclase type 10-like [Gallus gallus]